MLPDKQAEFYINMYSDLSPDPKECALRLVRELKKHVVQTDHFNEVEQEVKKLNATH